MISCSTTRGHMLDIARNGASDAVSLEVEAHIERCASCEDERARWRLFGVLKESTPPTLGEAAERRIIARLLAQAPDAKVAPSRSSWRLPMVAIVSLALVAVVVPTTKHFLAGRGTAGVAVEGQQIEATAPGVVSFGGAEVHYASGARMTLHPGTRTLVLSAGQADVDVTPGLPGHFRVVTPRFVVEVLGTRFIVTNESVRTLRGRVHVLDGQDRELAVLTAGGEWNLANVVPAIGPAPAPAVQPAPSAASVETPRRAAPRAVTASELLTRSRAALARGDSRQARALAQRILTASPTEHEAAAGQLLLADALLIEKRQSDAIEAYRRIVRVWTRAPEAEVAQFAIGQLLLERGAKTEAQVALKDYLARYPLGRFVPEAREHLALIRSGQ